MSKSYRSSTVRKLQDTVTAVFAEMRRINPAFDFRPNQITEIVKLETPEADDPENLARITFGPAVLSIPEKASHVGGRGGDKKLFVVIRGSLTLFLEDQADGPRTQFYATNIAYFREHKGKLVHIFGAHYDFDDSIAHPIFHSQISTHAEYATHVLDAHSNLEGLADQGDLVKGLLGNVRIPTAQMDFLAVLLQVCSDHLVNSKSTRGQRSRYTNIQEKCRTFRSFGLQHAGLQASLHAKCYRSPFWYESQ